MAATVAPRILTYEQRESWDRDGYLHLGGVLDASEIAVLRERVARLGTEIESADGKQAYWQDVFDAGNDRDLSINNAFRWCPGTEVLIDHPRALGAIIGLMGAYVQCVGSEIYVRYGSDKPLFDFHTDVGPALAAVDVPGKVIQLKAQFFLTDVLEPDAGNFTVVPGSHREDFPGKIAYGLVPRATQILAAAGDVVLFPLSLGHGVAPNRRGDIRHSVILRYAQMFCRPVDYWTRPPDEVMKRLSRRQRRMLGDLGSLTRPGDYYGIIPDQLEIMYGNEFSGSAEAQADSARLRAMMAATPYDH